MWYDFLFNISCCFMSIIALRCVPFYWKWNLLCNDTQKYTTFLQSIQQNWRSFLLQFHYGFFSLSVFVWASKNISKNLSDRSADKVDRRIYSNFYSSRKKCRKHYKIYLTGKQRWEFSQKLTTKAICCHVQNRDNIFRYESKEQHAIGISSRKKAWY